jgi:hypothetical protein
MRLLLVADDGTTVLAVDDAERYPLLELAAHLRLAITATAEGWDLPPAPPPDGPGEPRIIAAVQRDDDGEP